MKTLRQSFPLISVFFLIFVFGGGILLSNLTAALNEDRIRRKMSGRQKGDLTKARLIVIPPDATPFVVDEPDFKGSFRFPRIDKGQKVDTRARGASDDGTTKGASPVDGRFQKANISRNGKKARVSSKATVTTSAPGTLKGTGKGTLTVRGNKVVSKINLKGKRVNPTSGIVTKYSGQGKGKGRF